MIDLENIKVYQIERPNKRTAFGHPDEFDQMPLTHRDQIIFLNKDAGQYLKDFVRSAKLVFENENPFKRNNFKSVVEYTAMGDEQGLKKWLFNRKIPFNTDVFLMDENFICTTWKMVVKYSPQIFFADDIIVFDKTLNWCLFYFHHDHLFFGQDNVYDSTDDLKRMLDLNEFKKQHPNITFPY